MLQWLGDLHDSVGRARGANEVFARLEVAAARLGFEWCAFGIRLPVVVAKPYIAMFNNYPLAWQRRYEEARYIESDPTIERAVRDQSAIIWSDAVFAGASKLWSEAQDHGLRVGLAQSCFDSHGLVSLLTLARHAEPLQPGELAGLRVALSWLSTVAHQAFIREMSPDLMPRLRAGLTGRELDVLRWAAEGKTAEATAAILCISVDTVKFHTKNAINKLGSANKVAAVVRAYALGLLR